MSVLPLAAEETLTSLATDVADGTIQEDTSVFLIKMNTPCKKKLDELYRILVQPTAAKEKDTWVPLIVNNHVRHCSP